MKATLHSHRKKPHVLPPLSVSQSFLRPMDPLQPPDLLLQCVCFPNTSENRLGSPAPKPIPQEQEYDFSDDDGKPIIKISEHDVNFNQRRGIRSRESLRVDLLADPVFNNDHELIKNVQKRNSLRLSTIAKQHFQGRENFLVNNFGKNQLKYFQNDSERKIKCPSIHPLSEPENSTGETSCEIKTIKIPNRYTLLKPIGQGILENENCTN